MAEVAGAGGGGGRRNQAAKERSKGRRNGRIFKWRIGKKSAGVSLCFKRGIFSYGKIFAIVGNWICLYTTDRTRSGRMHWEEGRRGRGTEVSLCVPAVNNISW